jgi:hypothetical protein
MEARVEDAAAKSELGVNGTEISSLTGTPSEFNFLIDFLDKLSGLVLASVKKWAGTWVAVEPGALQPDVTRHACDGQKQGRNRGEKSNHHPAHGIKAQSSRVAAWLTLRLQAPD